MGRRRAEPRQLFIDTGGTFTDVVAILSDGALVGVKAPTDPDHPVRGVLEGVGKLAVRLGLTEAKLCKSIRRVGVSTSVVFDVLRLRRGRRVGLVVTRGQEDILEAESSPRPGVADETVAAGVPIARLLGRTRLLSRDLVLGVTERTDPQGRVLEALREDEARLAARRLRDRKAEAVVVLTLFDFANPTHENRIAEIVREEIGPDVAVVVGTDVSPLLREGARTTAAVVEAAARPALEAFVRELSQALRARGCKPEPVVMRAGGCVAAIKHVRALDSVRAGPIAACRGASRIAAARGLSEVLLADVGGQSFDLAWVGRRPDAPPELEGARLVLSMSLAEVHRIGPGASARAWVEPPVGLRVGHRPGEPLTPPACFGWNGQHPTITDADLVLGYLSGRQAGGAVTLDSQRAREAIEEYVARPLKVGLVEAADAIRRQADAQAREGIRRRLSMLGVAPQTVTMVVGGGSGPVHAAGIAEGLLLHDVLIPPGASVLGAFGTALAPLDVAVERAVSLRFSATTSPKELARASERLAKLMRQMEEEALRAIRRHDVPAARARISRIVALRSERMVDDTLLPIAPFRAGAAEPVRRLLKAFDVESEKHRTLVPREADGSVEIYAACVVASVASDAPTVRKRGGAATKPVKGAVISRRAACFGGQMVPVDVYDLGVVRPGNRITGPSLLEGNATTVVLPEGFELTMEPDRVLRMASVRPT